MTFYLLLIVLVALNFAKANEHYSRVYELVFAGCLIVIDFSLRMSLSDLNSLMEKFLPKIATDLTEGDCANLLLMMFHISDYSVDSML